MSPAVRAGGRTAGGGLSCRQDREAPTHLNYTKENFCIIRKPPTAADVKFGAKATAKIGTGIN